LKQETAIVCCSKTKHIVQSSDVCVLALQQGSNKGIVIQK